MASARRSLLVSQWSVSDSATKELMVAFYQKLPGHQAIKAIRASVGNAKGAIRAMLKRGQSVAILVTGQHLWWWVLGCNFWLNSDLAPVSTV